VKYFRVLNNSIYCNDCTTNDTCVAGSCKGTSDPIKAALVVCGGSPPAGSSTTTNNTTIIIFALAGAAACIGAIVGGAFLLKKVRQAKLMDPDTWNPDKIGSVGTNPLYKNLGTTKENLLYEGK